MYLPRFQSRCFELGWLMFNFAINKGANGLWKNAELCLYYAYHKHFEKVDPFLELLFQSGEGKDMRTWGRISALAALSEKIEMSTFLCNMGVVGSEDAWRGAAEVWTHPENFQRHRELCLLGLAKGLSEENSFGVVVAERFGYLFEKSSVPIRVPLELVSRYFEIIGADSNLAHRHLFGFDAWLNNVAGSDPVYALGAAELFIAFSRKASYFIFNYENNLTQFLTKLFGQAEEQEELDGGEMLNRVVAFQDQLLALGVDGVGDWLRAAEKR